jgi:hypothetical protein
VLCITLQYPLLKLNLEKPAIMIIHESQLHLNGVESYICFLLLPYHNVV